MWDVVEVVLDVVLLVMVGDRGHISHELKPRINPIGGDVAAPTPGLETDLADIIVGWFSAACGYFIG